MASSPLLLSMACDSLRGQGLFLTQRLLEQGLSGTGSTEQANAPQEDGVQWQGLGTVPGFSEFYLNSQSYLWVRLFISQKPDRLKLI